MYILVYNKVCFTPFVEVVVDILSPDGVIWIDSDGPHELPKHNHLEQYNLSHCIKEFKEKNINITKLVCFDIYLLPVVYALRIFKLNFDEAQLYFIQHGGFFDLSEGNRNNYNLHWIKRSILTTFRFMKTVNIFLWPKLFNIFFISFFRGSFYLKDKISDFVPSFKLGVFWNESDTLLLGNKIIKKFENIKITSSPDSSKVIFKRNKKLSNIYIDQPLLEDGIITHGEMESINKLINDSIEKIILHPRSNKEKFRDFKGQFIKLTNKKQIVECNRIIGHFSSLLLSVPSDISIKLVDLGNIKLKEANKKLLSSRKKVNINRPSFESIKEMIT